MNTKPVIIEVPDLPPPMGHYAYAVYSEVLGSHRPARAVVAAALHFGALIEIEAIAAGPSP